MADVLCLLLCRFVDPEKVTDAVKEHIGVDADGDSVKLKPYTELLEYLKTELSGKVGIVLLFPDTMNDQMCLSKCLSDFLFFVYTLNNEYAAVGDKDSIDVLNPD